jgi:hypothetical protein
VATKRAPPRRLAEGSVRVDGEAVSDDIVRPVAQWWGATIQVGKRKWARIVEPA